MRTHRLLPLIYVLAGGVVGAAAAERWIKRACAERPRSSPEKQHDKRCLHQCRLGRGDTDTNNTSLKPPWQV